MEKGELKVQLPKEAKAQLQALGAVLGDISANVVAAQILSEFSRINKTSASYWAAMGRIAEEAGVSNPELPSPPPRRLKRAEPAQLTH